MKHESNVWWFCLHSSWHVVGGRGLVRKTATPRPRWDFNQSIKPAKGFLLHKGLARSTAVWLLVCAVRSHLVAPFITSAAPCLSSAIFEQQKAFKCETAAINTDTGRGKRRENPWLAVNQATPKCPRFVPSIWMHRYRLSFTKLSSLLLLVSP